MPTIAHLLDRIDDGRIVIAPFQRGWVWKADAVRSLMESLYRGYPIGSIIVWPRREGIEAEESVIDGQQRLTALYGVMRGKLPAWLDADSVPTLGGLQFDLAEEKFFYSSSTPLPDAACVDVSRLYCEGTEWWLGVLNDSSIDSARRAEYMARVMKLLAIREKNIPLESLPRAMEPEHAEQVFEIVNTAGTRVNKGDLTLAQMSLSWREARQVIEATCQSWAEAGYQVKVDWMLHAMAALISRRIDFKGLFEVTKAELERASSRIRTSMDSTLNLLQQHLGLDPRAKLTINNGLIPVVVYRALNDADAPDLASEERALLAWWMCGNLVERWSRDTRNRTNADLVEVLHGGGSGLFHSLLNGYGGFPLNAGHLQVSYKTKRFSQLLYSTTRCCGGLDLGTGLALSPTLVGAQQGLHHHHLFPRRFLKANGYEQNEIDQLANIAYISQGSNLRIGSKAPAAYLGTLEERHPGVLASQWVPEDPAIWEVRHYSDFLAERRKRVAVAANELLGGLAGSAWDL